MLARSLLAFTAIALLFSGITHADQKDKKKRTGTLVGEIKSSKVSPNGKNQIIEVLASGEEKARTYRVQYDPSVKGPIPKVLEAVKAAKVGDRARLEWIDTGEGLAITAFQLLKKMEDGEKKDK
ncbi:MAG: hypothetical protein FJ303_08125 [Planctomycetes bacterium]|nr:hypothetical protein [Planctomycetota bacterium]